MEETTETSEQRQERVDREFKNRERMMCTCRLLKRFKKKGLLSKWTHGPECLLMQHIAKTVKK